MNIKKVVLCFALGSAMISASAQKIMSWEEAYSEADKIISKLTLDEKIRMTRGYSNFYFPGVPDKGIPTVYLSDATQGVRINRGIKDTLTVRPLLRSTAFPCPIMLSATFNPTLAYDYGFAVGQECNAGNIRVLLGPGTNIYRDSQCGRNFEYMGEDPYLASQMVYNYVTGMQKTGTAACVKHFVCNNTEYNRRTQNVFVDERTIHEIYMPAFQAAVDAGVAFIMTSYNLVNGEWAGQSSYVIKDLIRGDMGFKGAVMSDWKSTYDFKKVVLSGQNIEMPGSEWNVTIAQLNQYIRNGEVTEQDVDNMIRPLIATCIAFNLYDRNAYDPSLISTFPTHATNSYKVAAEGAVLLKNNGILPIAPSTKKILAIGKFLDEMPCGLGSGRVVGYDNITLKDALVKTYGDNITFVQDPSDEQLKAASCVIISAGTIHSESFEMPFALPKEDDELVMRALQANPKTVLLVNNGSGCRMTDYEPLASAILYGWYPGQAGMTALCDIISGKISPSGKLPISIEREIADTPAAGDLPADTHYGIKNFDEMLNPIYDITYDEGVFVGYRWYQAQNIKPLYPFGYGLSYTRFSVGKPKLSAKKLSGEDEIVITVPVRNIGGMLGAEVVQLYVGEDNPTVERPSKELKAFAKVEVKPGKSGIAQLKLKKNDLAFWDTENHAWKVNPGYYTINIGTSSDKILHTVKIFVE